MSKYFADVSAYQRDDLAFFQGLVNAGVPSILIKSTEGSVKGTNYVNPKLLNQTRNALKAGMNVGFYHFFHAISDQDAVEEAQFFESKVVELGFGKDTPLCLDVEDSKLDTSKVAQYVDSFINYLTGKGYTNVFQYSMASWFHGILNANAHPTWVASYGSNDCGARGNIIAWQYTNQWGGESQDMSIDWGVFNKAKTSKPVKKPAKPTIVNVVTALSGNTKGYTTYNSQGVADKDTNITPDSLWKSNNIEVINQKAYFQIATDMYLPQDVITLKGKLIINYVTGYGVNAYDSNGNSIKDSNLKFKSGTEWKVTDILTNIKNIGWCYQVAPNTFIPVKYQQGSGFTGK